MARIHRLVKWRSNTSDESSGIPCVQRPCITDWTNSQRSTTMKTKKRGGNGQDSLPSKVAKLEVTGQVDLDYVKEFTEQLYPDMLNTTHFVPPAHINEEKLDQKDFAGQKIYIPKPTIDNMDKGCAQAGVQESSCRDDEAHQRVLHCLHMIQEVDPQAMFVIGQLDYIVHIDQSLCDSKRVNPPTLRPAQSPPRHTPVKCLVPGDTKEKKKKKGDFDVLIISRDRGFLIIEIKAVGDVQISEADEAVLKKLIQAVEQLNKGQEVLQHLAKDKHPVPVIRSALALPNVRESQLRKLLQNNPAVKDGLCRCLKIAQTEDPVTCCLLADFMPPKEFPWQFKVKVRDRLLHWWRQVMGETRSEPAMTDGDYVDLIARFCGPDTFPPPSSDTKSVCRSLGEAAADIGDRYKRFILRPRQLGVLNTGGNLKFLSGPPGTGKTVLLILKACSWLLDNMHVHVVSTWAGSLAASHYICHVLRNSSPEARQRVHFLQFDVKEEGKRALIILLAAAAVRGPLFVICDEAFGGSEFKDLCTQLNAIFADLHLWAASVYHGYCPPCLDQETLTEPLRTPPAITRMVARSDVIRQGLVRDYSLCSTTMPSDGLRPLKIRHAAPGHMQGMPGDCVTCGKELGKLIRQLCANHTLLSWRDFFILTNHYDLVDEVKDREGNLEREASGLVQGLRNTDVEVIVLNTGDSPAIAEVAAMTGSNAVVVADAAAMTGPNAVVVADADTVRGLERKVVVWVQADKGGNSESGEMDFGRLDSMSRTTAQLIFVA